MRLFSAEQSVGDAGLLRPLLRCSRMSLPCVLLCQLILLATFTAALHADLFHLDDGRVLDGSIVREIGDLVSIRIIDGSVVTVDRSQIRKTELKATPFDEYKRRAAEIKAEDLTGHVDLARWCDGKSLKTEALKEWKIVIRIDPDHELARSKLGYLWIGGDWYLANSAEAKARKSELEKDPDSPVREIPKELLLPEWDQERAKVPELPPLPRSGYDRVVVVTDEKVGKSSPENSGLTYHLRRMGGKLQFVPGKDDGKVPVVVKVKIRCYFVKLQTFYGAPISNIFQGEAKAQFYERNSEGKMVLRKTSTIRIPFSASAARPKEQALQFTYYVTLESVAAKLSRWAWFKKRGSTSLPMPETL
jgi:hypothetical protein